MRTSKVTEEFLPLNKISLITFVEGYPILMGVVLTVALEVLTLAEMDVYWNRVKAELENRP